MVKCPAFGKTREGVLQWYNLRYLKGWKPTDLATSCILRAIMSYVVLNQAGVASNKCKKITKDSKVLPEDNLII